MDVEREITRLYGLPLDEFTSARNDAAKRLTKDGGRDAAAEVRALRKPTATAWAVNQLQREDKAGVRRLLQAADGVRQAQSGAVAGKGGSDLRELVREHQDAAESLVGAARRLLGETLDDGALNRVGPALLNASVDPEARELLEAGRLVREPEATGFGAFAGMPVKRSKAAPEPDRAKDDRARRKADERREKLKAAREELASLERRARDVARQAKAAEREVATARKRVERLEG